MTEEPLLENVVRVVEQVGDYQLKHFRALPPGQGDEKQRREYVSTVDLASEELLIAGLRTALPEAGILAEESGEQGSQELRWVIDPLDGTTNFLSGLDQFAISVALEKEGRSELGVVYRPASGEWFTAQRGRGFHYDGQKRAAAAADLPLARALLGTGFPFRSPDLAACFFPAAAEILTSCRGLRRFGSAALDLCYVAAGFLQGFWETDLQPYDVAAGLLFLEESGCRTSNRQGGPYNPHEHRLLICGWPRVHRELLPLVARHYPESL